MVLPTMIYNNDLPTMSSPTMILPTMILPTMIYNNDLPTMIYQQ
jgi:hypothetical protein